MQKIVPFLWFDGQAEEAVTFYLSVFEDGKIHATTRYPEGGPGQAGSVMTIAFEVHGEELVALNGGPGFPFTQAVSLVVNCESQEEIDHYWEKLSADGGEQIECGWLKDKFGMPWQIVPGKVWDWLRDDDPERVQRVTSALWQRRNSTWPSSNARLDERAGRLTVKIAPGRFGSKFDLGDLATSASGLR